jgi:hypothetical protein
MKSLVTADALVTLLAGVSIANGQMTRPPDNDRAKATAIQFASCRSNNWTGSVAHAWWHD